MYGWYMGAMQRSIDKGLNWEVVNHEVIPVQLAADPKGEHTIYAATPDGRGILVSRNDGKQWESMTPALEGGMIAALAIAPNGQHIYAFSEKLGGLGISNDRGRTWRKIDETFNDTTVLYIAISKHDPNILYAITHENIIYKSIDAGERWQKTFPIGI